MAHIDINKLIQESMSSNMKDSSVIEESIDVTSINSKLSAALEGTLSDVGDSISDAASKVGKGVTSGFKKGVGAVKDFGSDVANRATKTATSAGRGVSDAATFTKRGVRQIGNSIEGMASPSIGNKLRRAGAGIGDALTDAKTVVTRAASDHPYVAGAAGAGAGLLGAGLMAKRAMANRSK